MAAATTQVYMHKKYCLFTLNNRRRLKMNNAIKYIICAGASLALGFGSGYFFKAEQDKIACKSKAAQFEADSIQYANNSFRQISSDLYSAHKSADEIHKSLENISKGMDDMRGSYEGSPGLPGKTGIGDLFPGPGQKDGSEGKNENKGDEQSAKPYKSLQGISEDVNTARKTLQEIAEDVKAGRKALEVQREIFETIKDSVPSVPEIPVLPKSDSEKKYEQK